jgi:outer membrane protein assembly factor BamA
MGVVTWLLPLALLGQGDPDAVALRGQLVREVRLFAPPEYEDVDLRALSAVVEGRAYTPADVRRTIEVFSQIGRFSNVIARVTPAEPDGLTVSFELVPVTHLAEVRIVEAGGVSARLLRRSVGADVGAEIAPGDLRTIRARIENALARRGWRDPAIGLALETLDASGRRALLVRVAPGPRTYVRSVRFEGSSPFSSRETRARLDVESGDVLDLERLDARLRALERDFRAAGHWDAEVGPPRVVPGPASVEADLVVPLRPGPHVRVRFRGNARVSVRLLRAAAESLKTRGTDPTVLAEVRDRIYEIYTDRGHYQARVDVASRIFRDAEHREILFSIEEGPVGRVGRLRFPGRRSIPRDALERRTREVLAESFGPVAEQPGVDPVVVTQVVGGHSPPGPPPRRAPDTAAVDPQLIYEERAYRAVADDLAAVYRAAGFQQVGVQRPEIEERDGLLDVTIAIEEGPRWRVASVEIDGAEVFDPAELRALARRRPGVRAGAPLVFEEIEQARRRLVDHYRDRGYLYVSVEDAVEVPADVGSFRLPRDLCAAGFARGESDCALDVRFAIREGPRVKTRQVVVRGLEHTRPGVVDSELEVEPGAVLTARALERTRENLIRVGVFNRVTVRPIDEDRPEAVKDVIVEVRERKRFSLEIGAGASTEEGARTFAGFGYNNLFGSAIRLQLDGKVNVRPDFLLLIYNETLRGPIQRFYDQFTGLSRFEYQVSAGLSYPRIFGLPRGFRAGTDVIVLRDLSPAFLEETQTIAFSAAYSGWRPRLFGASRTATARLGVNFERADITCNQRITADDSVALGRACSTGEFDQSIPNQRLQGTNAYVNTGPTFSWDFRNDPVDPSAGAYFEVEGELSMGVISDSPDFSTLRGRASFFVPVLPRTVFAVKFLTERIFPFAGDDTTIPLNRRLFSGGRTTIRGYQENTLLPQDVLPERAGVAGGDERIVSGGGLLSIATQIELRVQIVGPLAIAGFYDVGDLWNSGRFSFSTTLETEAGETVTRSLAQAAGFGVRLATPVGPLAVDLGHPLNVRDPGSNAWQLHFSIGNF